MLNANNIKTNLTTTTDRTTIETEPPITKAEPTITKAEPTIMRINPMETTTESQDIMTNKVDLRTDSVLFTMSQKSDSTPKFQKCPKNLNTNQTMPNTTKSFNNLKTDNPSLKS